MKKKLVLGTLFVLTVLTSAIFIDTASAEKKAVGDSLGTGTTLLVEDFTYAPGSALTANGWTAHSGAGTNPIVTSEPSLTVSGYPSSGVGNSVALTTSGEDVNRTFAPQASGSVYAAFMVNVSEASTDPAGGYFFHLGPDPIGTTFRGRVFIKKDASNNIAFGISKALTAAADVAYTPFNYSLNTTYLVVVKYTVVDGATNDTVALFVSTTTPATEPAPTVSATDVAQSDITPASVALRQGSAATAPTVRVDGIRIGTSWESVTQPAATAATQHVVDFNGDGKTDFAVVRNVGGGPTGQVRWFINYNGTTTTVASDWGLANDTFVPEDYDGDDKTDIAVWRDNNPNEGTFYILQSQSNTVRIEPFGQSGDVPNVVGDYDGDGRADVAVYREGATAGEQSTWFYRGSANNPAGNITYVPWGTNGDFPAPGDYDGDDRHDFVVQRNDGGGRGRFWRKFANGATDTVAFGASGDLIVPGDYDGDGKTDIATARSVGGAIQWQYLSSQNATINYATFGVAATDFPVQGDYDGDGRTDFAVWRPSMTAGASTFWIFGSTSGAFGVPFGAQGDYPVANYNAY